MHELLDKSNNELKKNRSFWDYYGITGFFLVGLLVVMIVYLQSKPYANDQMHLVIGVTAFFVFGVNLSGMVVGFIRLVIRKRGYRTPLIIGFIMNLIFVCFMTYFIVEMILNSSTGNQ